MELVWVELVGLELVGLELVWLELVGLIQHIANFRVGLINRVELTKNPNHQFPPNSSDLCAEKPHYHRVIMNYLDFSF